MGEERLNAFSLVCTSSIFLDYDKIIEIYASKYPGRMLLINPLNEKRTAERLNSRKTYEAYKNFRIFSLYFIVVVCNNFCCFN